MFIGVHQHGVKINREGKNLLFAVLIYFTNVITITPPSGAALSWWLVIIMIWGLSIMFEWNIETIEKNGNYIHIFAWSPPAVLTLLAGQFETVSLL